MQIQVRKRGPFTILEVHGSMLSVDGGELMERFLPLLEAGDRTFIFDLTGVPDSATGGINTVVACRNKAVKRDGCVKLVLNERLRYLYTLLFLDTIFEIFDDLEEALVSAVEPVSA